MAIRKNLGTRPRGARGGRPNVGDESDGPSAFATEDLVRIVVWDDTAPPAWTLDSLVTTPADVLTIPVRSVDGETWRTQGAFDQYVGGRYTVFSGEITWYRGDDPTDAPQLIGPGETVVVRPGDALVESPDSIHQGRNDGTVPLVIYLSTLFPADAPRAIVVEATPLP